MLTIGVFCHDTRELKTYIENFFHQYHVNVIIDFFNDENITNIYDIAFIYINDHNHEVVKEIVHKVQRATIILLSEKDIMINTSILRPITFLQLPLKEKQINTVLDQSYHPDVFIFHNKQGKLCVPLQTICYFEYKVRKIVLYTKEETFTFYGSLSEIEKTLNSKGFMLAHQAFLVNLSYIQMIYKNEITLQNNIKIPLAKHKASEFRNKYKIYVSSSEAKFPIRHDYIPIKQCKESRR